MKISELIPRIKAAKARIPKLIEKYPVVAGAMILAGLIVGFILGLIM